MFNVGDVVRAGVTEYTVAEVRLSNLTLRPRGNTGQLEDWYSFTLFTLVTPTKPVLTGMTQFIKDTGGKYAT